jgi:hypothetical protein
MITEMQVAHGGAALTSASPEIMGGPDKPGHDDQDGEGVSAKYRLCLRT